MKAAGSPTVALRPRRAGLRALFWLAPPLLAVAVQAQPIITNLGTLPDTIESFASNVSSDASVVAGYCVIDHDEGNSLAFRWTRDGGLQNLGGLPGGAISSYSHDLSADGAVL